jgi:hypothetical protein
MSNNEFKARIARIKSSSGEITVTRKRTSKCLVRTRRDRGYYPPRGDHGGCTKVHDIDERGRIIRGETRKFEDENDALDYAKSQIPTGEAWAVVNPHNLVMTFGSKVALRKGGWL